jgi:hypothetical protein
MAEIKLPFGFTSRLGRETLAEVFSTGETPARNFSLQRWLTDSLGRSRKQTK